MSIYTITYQLGNNLFLKQACAGITVEFKRLCLCLSAFAVFARLSCLTINVFSKKALKVLLASAKSKFKDKAFSALLVFSIGVNFHSPQIIKIQAENINPEPANFVKHPFLKEKMKMINKGKAYLIDENTLIAANSLNLTLKKKIKEKEREEKEKQKKEGMVRRETVNFTAYSSTVFQCDGDPFTTASGSRARDGVTAANFLPFGTKFKIPEIFGDKVFVVEDRMSKRYWKTVDIWMPNYRSAINFGKKYGEIEILPK